MTKINRIEWDTDYYATTAICTIVRHFIANDNITVTSQMDVARTIDGILFLNFGKGTGHTTALTRLLEKYQPDKMMMFLAKLPLWNHVTEQANLNVDQNGYPPNVGRIPIDEIKDVDPDSLLFMRHPEEDRQKEAIETYHNAFEKGKCSPCATCKGKGRVELFRSFEDPCQECMGSGKQGETAPKFIVIKGQQSKRTYSLDTLTIEMTVSK